MVISQVTNAQLEALRIENRHLRDTALNEQLTVSHNWSRVQDQCRFFYSVLPYTAGNQNKILDWRGWLNFKPARSLCYDLV